MTIKERANEYAKGLCEGIDKFEDSLIYQIHYDEYIDIATDQDHISREDEKEKILNKVYKWLANYEPLLQSNCIASDLINRLRQAMEK